MAEPDDMNNDMIGTQIPPPDIADLNEDTVADDGEEPHNDEYVSDEEAAPDLDYQEDDEDINGEQAAPDAHYQDDDEENLARRHKR
jgi:hypothetical protein